MVGVRFVRELCGFRLREIATCAVHSETYLLHTSSAAGRENTRVLRDTSLTAPPRRGRVTLWQPKRLKLYAFLLDKDPRETAAPAHDGSLSFRRWKLPT